MVNKLYFGDNRLHFKIDRSLVELGFSGRSVDELAELRSDWQRA